jgi:hypothetical protein
MFELTATCQIRKNQPQFVAAQVTLERLGNAIEKYRADCGGYPTPQMGLRALVVNPGVRCWNGPYTRQPLMAALSTRSKPSGRRTAFPSINGIRTRHKSG